MARYIHCEECKQRIEKSAILYNELYEFIGGFAKQEMYCDGACGKKINKKDFCYAAVLLPNRSHPNYSTQKPDIWADVFINVTEKTK